MKQNFWQKLKKPARPDDSGHSGRPFFVLAPMADVTDIAFREIIAKYSNHGKTDGGPDIFWTEFVSADGLVSEKGREHLMIDLAYTENERPIVAQLFTSNPDNMRKAAEIVRELGFDGLDINMGCPDRSIEKQGAGAALMKNPKLAQEIIYAAKDGAGDIPVSVKTRLGYNKDVLEEWLPMILETKPVAITLHARTRKDMSKVPARWERVKDAVEIAKGSGVLILGNGDVTDIQDAKKKCEETGADGAMLGRAIFGNPWLFDKTVEYKNIKTEEKLRVMVEHTRLFEKYFMEVHPVKSGEAGAKQFNRVKKNFAIMKKHYKAYCNGFDGAKELRMSLMEAENADRVDEIVKSFLKR